MNFVAEKLLTFQSTSCWEIPYWPKAFQVLLYKQRNGASCILRMRNNCTRPFSGFFNPGGAPGSYKAAADIGLCMHFSF
jgi:hypothetical protein